MRDETTDKPALDLTCVSYTAATRVLRLERYPQWNEGAEITSEDWSLAGDGPLVAGFATGLGLSVGLETNAVGLDEAGAEVTAFLDRHRIRHTALATASRTPRAYILSHPDGAREWLVDLQGAAHDLGSIEGGLIRRARLVYIDCFASISEGAVRALELARQYECAVYANLGTLNIGDELERSLRSHPLPFVQASVPEKDAARAPAIAQELAARYQAGVVYVTLSSLGAIARESEELVSVPARMVNVDYTHGAGAAFSAGTIYGRQCGWPLRRALEFACALGSMQCTVARREAPTEEEVSAFLELA